MTTATDQTAPLEEEIIAAIDREVKAWPGDSPYRPLEEAADHLVDIIRSHRLSARDAYAMGDDYLGDAVWRGLSPDQERRLRTLLRSAKHRAIQQAFATMVVIVAEAGRQFAAEYPDAPRSSREDVEAQRPQKVPA